MTALQIIILYTKPLFRITSHHIIVLHHIIVSSIDSWWAASTVTSCGHLLYTNSSIFLPLPLPPSYRLSQLLELLPSLISLLFLPIYYTSSALPPVLTKAHLSYHAPMWSTHKWTDLTKSKMLDMHWLTQHIMVIVWAEACSYHSYFRFMVFIYLVTNIESIALHWGAVLRVTIR